MFWVAGFDILYGLQDLDFDRGHGLYSIPRIFGIKYSLLIARVFHLITVILLITLLLMFDLGIAYLIGVLIAAVMLIYEHSLVKPDDLSKLNMAFFMMNGYISITVFIFTLLNFIV
jgi:4-hydroxybenzoate polyprenyltransferase